MISVLLDGRPALRGIGGIARYARSVIESVPLADRQIAFSVFAWRKEVEVGRKIAGGVPVKSSPVPGKIIAWVNRGTFGLALPNWGLGKPRFFHGLGFDMLRIRNVFTIATIHDVGYLHVPETYPLGAAESFDRAVRQGLSYVDHVVTDSEHAKAAIVEAYNISEDRITVIHLGVSRYIRALDSNLIGAQTAITHTPFLLYVGEITPRKNLLRLLQAFQMLSSRVPHSLFLAGGSTAFPSYAAEVGAEIVRLGLEQRVSLLGFQTDDQINQLYSECDAFVFPSLYEGFGYPIVEAMSFGKPIVASNVASIPEIAGDGAVLVDPYSIRSITDGIEAVLTDEPLRLRLSNEGRIRARLFTEEGMANNLCKLYRSLT